MYYLGPSFTVFHLRTHSTYYFLHPPTLYPISSFNSSPLILTLPLLLLVFYRDVSNQGQVKCMNNDLSRIVYVNDADDEESCHVVFDPVAAERVLSNEFRLKPDEYGYYGSIVRFLLDYMWVAVISPLSCTLCTSCTVLLALQVSTHPQITQRSIYPVRLVYDSEVPHPSNLPPITVPALQVRRALLEFEANLPNDASGVAGEV